VVIKVIKTQHVMNAEEIIHTKLVTALNLHIENIKMVPYQFYNMYDTNII